MATSELTELEEQGIQALRVIRHDFKTPLTSLRMLGQIFQMGAERGTLAEQPERTERNCRMLVEQVDRLVQLADNLYDISLAQSGKLVLKRQLADLRPILQTLGERFASKIKSLLIADEPLWGEWDTGRMETALAALFEEGEALSVGVQRDEKSEWVTIDITGEFKTATEKTAPSRYLARVIIEHHGGTLDGRFRARLPLTCRK